MDYDLGFGKTLAVYGVILGILYLIIGLVEVPGDVFGGLALVVISAVYLYGIRGLWSAEYGGLSFIIVGLMLSAIYGILYLLLMGADYLMYTLGKEEFSAIASFRPEIWLFLISLPAAYFIWSKREIWL